MYLRQGQSEAAFSSSPGDFFLFCNRLHVFVWGGERDAGRRWDSIEVMWIQWVWMFWPPIYFFPPYFLEDCFQKLHFSWSKTKLDLSRWKLCGILSALLSLCCTGNSRWIPKIGLICWVFCTFLCRQRLFQLTVEKHQTLDESDDHNSRRLDWWNFLPNFFPNWRQNFLDIWVPFSQNFFPCSD